jgi:hypothetical protein
MNPEVKSKWLEALRSGKYKQGQRRLRTADKFCCLGVLCDVLDSSKWRNKWEDSNVLLPRDVSRAVGLGDRDDGEIPREAVSDDERAKTWLWLHPVGPIPLSVLNDSGFKFEEIAGLIERYL